MNWDYLAGWFDADGSVKPVQTKKGDLLRQYVHMQFANSNLDVILAIREFLGLERLKITYEPESKYHNRTSDYHRLQVTKRDDVVRILRKLEHRCITKKHDIQVALAFMRRVPVRPRGRPKKKRRGGTLYV